MGLLPYPIGMTLIIISGATNLLSQARHAVAKQVTIPAALRIVDYVPPINNIPASRFSMSPIAVTYLVSIVSRLRRP
jgi:hypothetical protein